MVARGEVWWYEDPVAGRHPHVILTRSEVAPFLNEVVGAAVTRRERGIATEVRLTRRDGMPSACIVSLDNITLLRKSLCTKRITALSRERMIEVCEALRLALGC